ncbi:LA2681 family HEPN domain-containing protein [Sphingopyxis sp. Q841]|uniref:LA2681 family HEPN domain-containing protein n=1 Tax=Sphingopyxis sp. Q841 TaxID=3458250 RepID=UPI004035721D
MTENSLDPQLEQLAAMVDEAADTGDAARTDAALVLSEAIGVRTDLGDDNRALLHYFRANAYSNKLHEAGQTGGWQWDIPHLESILLELRSAVRHEGFEAIGRFRQCQILTNLGNNLSSVGRPVEALAHWDRAIALIPHFAMAQANRAHGLIAYSQSLYDRGHSGLLMLAAYDGFVAACDENALFDAPENLAHTRMFEGTATQIAERLSLPAAREDLAREYSLGRSKLERRYRRWALDHRLFLNPLNDLGAYTIAANDVLHLPSLRVSIDEGGPGPPTAFGFFNQLKQEFISARLLYFEGQDAMRPHFSDRDAHLFDLLNLPAYSLGVEKTKIALRLAYSLLDKIAFFINDYFAVGLPEKAVSFRSVWYERRGDPKALAAVFRDRENWPLRGLYWLSKDMFEPSFQDVAEPEAEGLAQLRNHIEHKYCQVHEDLGLGYSRFALAENDGRLGYRIGRDMLEAKSLHILKKARAALIYLSLAVHREERVRAKASTGLIIPAIPLMPYRDIGRLDG